MLYAESAVDYPQAGRYGLLAGVLVVWCLASIILGVTGVFADPASTRQSVGLFSGLPPLIAYLAWRYHGDFRAWVLSLDRRVLVALHATRTVGLGFIFLHLQGHLHGLFAYTAGIGDAIAAFWAWGLAVAMFKGQATDRAVRTWNRAGLIDFVLALSLGFGLRSAALGDAAANTDLMVQFPLSLFPTFLVPMMILLHMAIAAQLAHARG